MQKLKHGWNKTPKFIRQVLVAILGTLVIIAGIIMLITPGPGWVTIFLGLAILATEFVWAHRARDWVVGKFKSAYEAARGATKNKSQKP